MTRAESTSAHVVLFSGGSGSRVLSSTLIRDPRVQLTVAINGYDDGKSTGAVRRFLGDSLGPSDYRKNASWLARQTGSCDDATLQLLDARFAPGCRPEAAIAALRVLASGSLPEPRPDLIAGLPQGPGPDRLADPGGRLARFLEELEATGKDFDFGDCSLGNLVFAGCYLEVGRDFNRAVAAYCRLVGLPDGIIENVTDGSDAHLVAVTEDGRVLASEAAIVEAEIPVAIRDIHLLAAPLPERDLETLAAASEEAREELLRERSVTPAANPRLLERLRDADLIVYAPGTQHSSLFPSYLTPGVGEAIAANLRALKVLITNIREDAEIGDTSATDLVDKALHYLRRRGRDPVPAPCLVTHILLNDPGTEEAPGRPYVPLGRLEEIDDPRLVRIADYEDADSGHHDASRVLTPLVEGFLGRGRRPRVAVLLLEAGSVDAVVQTVLEMTRTGAESVDADVAVFYEAAVGPSDDAWKDALPVAVTDVADRGGLPAVVADDAFDFFVLFESSGMYKGRDIVNVTSLLRGDRFDAVWGSRRLSVRDIRHSYRLRYRHRMALGAVSYLGSHLLSLTCLVLYGRYISDTLSGVRAVRRRYLRTVDVGLDDPTLNQHLLAVLMRDRAELFETPVQFFSLGPDRVRRTTTADGLRALAALVRGRWRPTVKTR